MTEVLLLAIVFLLVLVNGYFVAAEFAIVRARPSKLQQLSQEGDARAARALHQVSHVDEYVATSQVGITLASLAIGFLAPARARPVGLVRPCGVAGDRADHRLRDRHPPPRDPR